MKLIPLSRGLFAQVDDDMFDYLNQWKWYAHKHGNTYYARRNDYKNGKQKTLRMHNLIINKRSGMQTDHRDHNGLNNQRYNLREATTAQNQYNNTPRGSSKYLGVCVRQSGERKGVISAQIRYNKHQLHLGYFKTEEEAGLAYDIKAKELFGEFANLNFK